MEFKKKIISIVVLGFVIVAVLTSGMLLYSENNMANEIETQLTPPLMQQWAEQTVSAKSEALAKEFQAFFDEVEALGTTTEKLAVIGIQELESEGYKFGEGGDYVEPPLNEILMEHFETVAAADSRISSVYFGDKYGNMFIYQSRSFPKDTTRV